MIETGGIAPDFTLTSHLGDEVQLSSYKSQKNIVLSFHIYSFTGGWTHQVSSFRLNNKDFEDIDTQILGISCDSKPAQTAFSGSLGSIPYPLLSDFYCSLWSHNLDPMVLYMEEKSLVMFFPHWVQEIEPKTIEKWFNNRI